MTIETVTDLPALATQTEPISPAVQNFYNTTFALGTGPNGTFLTSDFFGTAAGVPGVSALTASIQILTAQTANGTLDNLALIYMVMKNTVTGVFGGPLFPNSITIPAGLPGAGTYSGVAPVGGFDSAGDAIVITSAVNPSEQAFAVLIPLAESAIAAAAVAMGTNTDRLNTAFVDIASTAVNVPVNFARAGVDFATLPASSQTSILAFVTGIPGHGQNTGPGQSAEVLEALADQNTATGQAIVGALREGRNNQQLDSVGINRYNTIPTPD